MHTLEAEERMEFEARYQPPEDMESIGWLAAKQSELLEFCQRLEEIADSLPLEVDRQKCISAAKVIGPLTRSIHQYEESVLFPWLQTNVVGHPELIATLERLKFEHCEDECFIEELIDALLSLGAGDQNINAETTGYMLRGFFVGVRRHVAFEREYLLGLVNGASGSQPIAPA